MAKDPNSLANVGVDYDLLHYTRYVETREEGKETEWCSTRTKRCQTTEISFSVFDIA